jgi:hypothetical protein
MRAQLMIDVQRGKPESERARDLLQHVEQHHGVDTAGKPRHQPVGRLNNFLQLGGNAGNQPLRPASPLGQLTSARLP